MELVVIEMVGQVVFRVLILRGVRMVIGVVGSFIVWIYSFGLGGMVQVNAVIMMIVSGG